MELEKVLQNLGLNEKEAKVYLALLQLGTASVPAVSQKAGIKRPTAYLILEEIQRKGLATLLPRKDKVFYMAESPEKILKDLEQKEKIIKEKIPELLAIFNTKQEKPKVIYYQGEENIIKLYEEVFREKEILFYGSIASISAPVYERINKYIERIKKEKLNVREILQADKESMEFKKNNQSENHQIKITLENYKFPTDNMIFGNKVAIITYKDNPMAVVIESTDVVATYKSMFEIIWKSIKNKTVET